MDYNNYNFTNFRRSYTKQYDVQHRFAAAETSLIIASLSIQWGIYVRKTNRYCTENKLFSVFLRIIQIKDI